MGRVNNLTFGAFTDIVGNQKKTPSYLRFLGIQDLLALPSTKLSEYLEIYRKYVTQNKPLFEMLGKLEDVVMQIRARDNLIRSHIKLNIVRNYIYARVPFHRTDREVKDIRVIVDKVDRWGADTDKLYLNKTFMDKAKTDIINGMNNVIDESINVMGQSWNNDLISEVKINTEI